MDISSLTGSSTPEKEKQPAMKYTAQATSPLVSGEVKLTVDEDGLLLTALLDAAEIPYADMTSLMLHDYVVTIVTVSGNFAFSRMGSWAQPFYDALMDAYNKKVRKALFVSGQPVLTTKGNYQYAESGFTVNGSAAAEVYENCICVLPPNMNARRIPLCFLTELNKGDYELTLQVDSDAYKFSKLGYDTSPFADAVEKQIRQLREKALATVKELDPSLSMAQASAIARLMPEGAAVQMGALRSIAPSFAAALENKIEKSRAAESYSAFKELCDPAQICVGFKKNAASGGESSDVRLIPDLAGGMGGNPLPGAGSATSDNAEVNAKASEPYTLWMIAPSPDGRFAAVEFAQEDSATFLYRTNGDFSTFARQLNRALEAIDFKREVIRLTDTELLKPENQNYRMAVERNSALQFVCACFVGRAIHHGINSWKRSIMRHFNDDGSE